MMVNVSLTELTCCGCQIHFAMDNDLYQHCQDTGRSFWCPNGHCQVFTETEVMRLKREKEELERRARSAEFNASFEKQQRIAIKGQFTKYRNRVANGVCPCCNRNFANLARHMASQHQSEPISKAAIDAAHAKKSESPQKNIIHAWGGLNRLKLQKCVECGVMRGNIEKHWLELHGKQA